MKTQELLKQIAQEWEAARPEIDPMPMITVITIHRTSLVLERAIEEVLGEYDLNASSFDVLATLRRLDTPSGMPLMQLASLMAVTPSSITNRVDRLVERGLVERHLSPTDRRSWLVRLLPEGRRIVDELIPKHMERERQLLSALSDQEREQLRNLLGKIIAGVEQRETSR